MPDLLTRALAIVAPERAVRRMRARLALAHYEAATPSRRATWRPVPGDADTIAWGARDRIALAVRDLARNDPWAHRAVEVIVQNAVGDGIIPKVLGGTPMFRRRALEMIERHLDTPAVDADGRTSLYGLQALVLRTVIESGECLVRHRPRRPRDGLPLPFQLQVLEPEYLDTMRDGAVAGGGWIKGGIEFDARGRRVAYWLHREHPGALGYWRGGARSSVRVPASEVAHVYRMDRPGQTRGVSWLAQVALKLQDLHDLSEAQLLRQKIAACFAAFRVPPEGERVDDPDPGGLATIKPGRIQQLGPGEDIKFAEPPQTGEYGSFAETILRSVAAGVGITYEALSGDLRGVNFSSGRMGRLEMNRMISAVQWQMLVPQLCMPIGRWFLEAYALQTGRVVRDDMRIEWVPPPSALVNPAEEIKAAAARVRAGFTSRSQVIRELGYDPERVIEEIAEDAREADEAGLVFDTDPRRTSQGGQAQPALAAQQGEQE